MKVFVFILVSFGLLFSSNREHEHVMDELIEHIIERRVEAHHIMEIKGHKAFKDSIAHEIQTLYEIIEEQAKIVKEIDETETAEENEIMTRLMDYADEGGLIALLVAWQGTSRFRSRKKK